MHALVALIQFIPKISGESESVSQPASLLFLLDAALGAAAACIILVAVVQWRRARSAVTERPAPGLPDVPWGAEAVAGPLLGYLLGYSLIMLLTGNSADTASRNALVPLLAGAAAQIVGAVVCLWIVANEFDGGIPAFLFGRSSREARAGGRPAAAVLIVALTACPALLALTYMLCSPIWPQLVEHAHPTIELLRSGKAPASVIAMLWLGAVVVAPVAEECFFRGVLQNMLRTCFGRRWAGIAATSAVFALVHAGQPATLPAIYLLSVLLGWLYERNANVLSPIIVHALFNARTMLWETFTQASQVPQ